MTRPTGRRRSVGPGPAATALLVLALVVVGCARPEGAEDPSAPAETATARADEEADDGGDVTTGDPSVTGSTTATTPTGTGPAGPGRLVAVGPPWIGPGGNRVAVGRGALDRARPVDVAVPGIPVRVLPVRGRWLDPGGGSVATGGDGSIADDREDPEPRWYVELASGSSLVIDASFTVVEGVEPEFGDTVAGFTDPLPDAVPVELGGVAVALVDPTDRYPHGALGDRIEAAAIEVVGPDGPVRFGPEPPAVIEGISAIMADANGDGQPEILVTESDADQGASLVLWSLDGHVVARSTGIGLGNRWRNQLAVAPVGPDGEVEVIDVRTPHIGGTVQYFRIEGDALVRVASRSGFTSHGFGSRNLDEGVVVDADGDGTLDVVVPTDDRRSLGILTRVDGAGAGFDGVEIGAEVALPGRMSTNLGVAVDPEADEDTAAPVAFAVGTEDGVVRIWPAPDR